MKKQKIILWRILAVLLMISLFGGNIQGAVYAAEMELSEEEEQLPETPGQELEPKQLFNGNDEDNPEVYEIAYELDGGENHPENPTSYIEGEDVFLNEPKKDGYWFKGWYLDSNFRTRIEQISPEMKGNATLFARWKPIEYKITYHLDGGINNYKNLVGYNTESTPVNLRPPVKIGYTFCGWYQEDTYETEIKDIPEDYAGDVVLYAKWEVNDYKLTYSLGEGAINSDNNPETYQVLSPTFILEAPTRVGYEFKGWYLEDTYKTLVTEITTGSFGNKILYAKWMPIKYQISYVLDGGKNDTKNPKNYDITSKTFVLKNASKAGYTFQGWFTDSNFETRITEIPQGSVGDLELYAKWKLVEYTITYVGIEQEDLELNPAVFDVETETIHLKSPAKDGYVFIGWYSDNRYKKQVTEIPKGSTGNKIIYARWAPSKYTIRFHGNGSTSGSMSDLKDCKYDKKSTLPENEYKRLWYTFAGWNTQKDGKGIAFEDEDQVKELIANENGIVTLYAQWKKRFDKKGIDVSEYQGTINWTKVKNDGVSFAMLRIVKGSTGNMKTDAQFERNYKNARNAGVNVGVYRYTYAKNTSEARKEAKKVLDVLDGRTLDYPVVLDIEDSSLLKLSTSERTAIVLAFQEVVEDAGYDFAVYASLDWVKNKLDMNKLDDVDLWLARWRSVDKGHGYSGKGNLVMWQYMDSGRVSGISGNVDMNISY